MHSDSSAPGGDPVAGANHGTSGDANKPAITDEVPGDATVKTEAEPKHQTDKIARQRGMLPIRRPTER